MTETEGPVSTSRIDTMKTLAQAIKKDGETHFVELVLNFDAGEFTAILAVENGNVIAADDPRLQWITEKQHPDKNPRPVRLLEVVSWYKRQKYNRETKEPKPIEFVELKPLNLTSAS